MPPPFVDVNGDGYLTSADAVFAISCLNGNISGESLVSWPADPADDLSGISTLPAESDPPTPQELPVGNTTGGFTSGGTSSGASAPATENGSPTELDDTGYSRPAPVVHPATAQQYILESLSRGTPARGWASVVQGNPLLASGIEGLELL